MKKTIKAVQSTALDPPLFQDDLKCWVKVWILDKELASSFSHAHHISSKNDHAQFKSKSIDLLMFLILGSNYR